MTQGVRQLPPVDKGDYIFIGAEVYDLPPQEDVPIETPHAEEGSQEQPLTLEDRVTAVEEKTDGIIEIVGSLV